MTERIVLIWWSCFCIGVGYALTRNPWVGGIVVSLILVLATLRFGRNSRPRDTRWAWLPFAWLALFFVSSLDFSPARSPLDVTSGAASLSNMVELAIYALIGALILMTWPTTPGVRFPARWFPILIGWPVVAIASTMWSMAPLFTLVRSMQLLVPLMLALLTARVVANNASAGEILLGRTLRLLVLAVVGLSVSGFIYQPGPDERFTWPGMHTGVAATVAGVALLVILLGSRDVTRLTRLGWATCVGIFTSVILLSRTRSVWVALVVACAATLWIRGRARPAARYIGLPMYVASLAFAIALAQSQVVEYLLRGERTYTISTLTGRIPLWQLALESLDSTLAWLLGLGYGAARVVLYPQAPWAGTAHNSWVELLLGIGIVGTALVLFTVFVLSRRLINAPEEGSFQKSLSIGILIYLVIVSGISEVLALPGFGLSVFCFLLGGILATEMKVAMWNRRIAGAAELSPA